MKNVDSWQLARRIGINVSWFFIFLLIWIVYSNSIVEVAYPKWPTIYDLLYSEKPLTKLLEYFSQELGFYQFSSASLSEHGYKPTLWLFLARLHSLLLCQTTITQARSLLFSTPPPLDEELVDQVNDNNIKRRKNLESRQPIHCLCVRIVTRGDTEARPLLRKAVTAAIRLFSEMCRCEKLKAHIVTQTQFLDNATKEKLLELGATEVKEIVVPLEYKTPKGTLYKARNLCYWQERGGVGEECMEDRSWILSLDEEAVITRSFVASFINDVLRIQGNKNRNIGYALSPAIFDVKTTPVAFLSKMVEARWVAHHYSALQCQMQGSEGTLCFHGGAFLVRASVDRLVGNDWGPKASVAEDYANGVCANEKKIPFKYLNGWFIEGTSPTLTGYILHGARVFRGQLYATYYLEMSRGQLVHQIFRLAVLFTYPFLHLFMVLWVLSSPFAFLPAGPSCLFLDLFFIFSLSVQACSYIFGATVMQMTRREIFFAFLISPIMVLVLSPIIDACVVIGMFWFMYIDWKTGNIGFVVTNKVA